MSLLLDLPTELLARIIGFTIPEGFEASMMSCKRIYAVGDMYREKHNRLAKRFRIFEFGDDDISSSWELLAAIAEEPQIADYIQTAYLHDDAHRGFLDDDDESELEAEFDDPKPPRMSPDDPRVSIIKDLLQRSEIFKIAHVDRHEWLENTMKGELTAQVNPSLYSNILLLTLLPNIRALALPKAWKQFHLGSDELPPLKALLHTLVRSAVSDHRRDVPLAKLTNLYPCGLNHGYEERMGLRNFGAFFALPSIRSVSAVSCIASDDMNSGIPFSWPLQCPESHVESLELYASVVEGPETEKLVKELVNLRSLRLTFETKWHGCGHTWDIEEFFDALKKCVSSSLKELSVTIRNYFSDGFPSRIETLQEFTQLEDFEVDVRFFGVPILDSAIWGEDAKPEKPATIQDIPCLADILPPTIRTVKILTGTHQAETKILKKLFTGFRDAAVARLPNLQSVSVTRGTVGVGETRCDKGQGALAWAEVKTLVRKQGYVYREIAEARAEWLSDFFERFQYVRGSYT